MFGSLLSSVETHYPQHDFALFSFDVFITITLIQFLK